LKEIDQAMDSMITQNDLARFLKNPENAQVFNHLVEDIRYALMDYKVCAPEGFALIRFKICLRLRYNETSTTRTASRWETWIAVFWKACTTPPTLGTLPGTGRDA